GHAADPRGAPRPAVGLPALPRHRVQPQPAARGRPGPGGAGGHGGRTQGAHGRAQQAVLRAHHGAAAEARPEPGPAPHRSRLDRADHPQDRAGGQPGRLERRPCGVAPRDRCGGRAGRRRLRHPAARPVADHAPGGHGDGPRRGVLRAELLPVPARLRPPGADLPRAGRRHRPDDHQRGVGTRLRRGRPAGGPQHRRPSRRRAVAGAARDADRLLASRRPACDGRAVQPRRPAQLHLLPRPGRRLRYPHRAGATRTVVRNARQETSTCRGEGHAGAGQDDHPADLLHPALPVHRRARARGHQHHGQFRRM
ncbi:MAG: Type II/IV secretion system protein TadC, associated with Flp pilus assembly, partial [uncultured Nocardioides sp.]